MPKSAQIVWNGPAIVGQLRVAAARGQALAVEHLLGVARDLAPLEEGTLRRSGVASNDAATLTAAVSFDTPYAVRQHEDLRARHTDGQAKYLEGPMTSEAATMAAILATEMRKATK